MSHLIEMWNVCEIHNGFHFIIRRLQFDDVSVEVDEETKKILEEKQKEIEKQNIESTQRSIALLKEIEEVGIATANELVNQGEQLKENVKGSSSQRRSKKERKGFFAGVKKMFTGKRDSEDKQKNQFDQNLDEMNESLGRIKESLSVVEQQQKWK